MKHSITFLVEARKQQQPFAPINVDVNYTGLRIRYYTGYRLSTENWVYNGSWIMDNWDVNAHRVVSGYKAYDGKTQVTAIQVNRKLDKVNGNIADDLFNTDLPPSKDAVLSYLDSIFKPYKKQKERAEKQKELSFWQMYERYCKEAKVSPGRRKQIKVTMNHLKAFDPNLTFAAVTPEKLRKFERYLLSDDPPKSKNTVSGQIKKFRAFWNWAKLERSNLHYPFEGYKIDAEEYGEPIFLTKDEIETLYRAKITDERLKRIRDIFLFQCYVGCRVGDLVKLTTDNIINGSVQYIPRKTKDNKPVTVTIPLTKRAKEIISRYKVPGGMLLPFISPQKYNDAIRDLFKNNKVKLDRTVIRLNPLTREEEAVKLCDIASSHLCRRTFIGNLFGKVDTSIIQSMTGHAKDSKAFGRYYSVTDELKQQAIKNLE